MIRPVLIFLLASSAMAEPPALLDDLHLADSQSESAHHLTTDRSEVVDGAMGQKARRLLPAGGKAWEGGKMSFTMAVDPERPTYLTVRLWGGDPNPNALILFCEGKQVGYRHLGDVDVLALPD